MRINNRYFPHPVLAEFSSDYIEGNFNGDIIINKGAKSYHITVKFELSCLEIESLISNNMAFFIVHIECSSTRFRVIKKTRNNEITFHIPSESIEGKVEIVLMIVSSVDLRDYSSKSFNEHLKHKSFDIETDEVLAIGNQESFIAERDNDPLEKISSIFSVVEDNELCDNINYSVTGEKILIYISNKNYTIYRELKKNIGLHSVLAYLFVMPVLIDLIKSLSYEDSFDYYYQKKWFRVINNRLKDLGYDLKKNKSEDFDFEVVQNLIGNPFGKSLKELEILEEALMD